ncbi:hypothetical protein ACRRTK_006281 [Alexandromys fortis]
MPVPNCPTVLLEKKEEAGLQSAILGVQLQVPSVTELHIQGLLEQHGSVGSDTLRIKENGRPVADVTPQTQGQDSARVLRTVTKRTAFKVGVQGTGAQESPNCSAQMELWTDTCHHDANLDTSGPTIPAPGTGPTPPSIYGHENIQDSTSYHPQLCNLVQTACCLCAPNHLVCEIKMRGPGDPPELGGLPLRRLLPDTPTPTSCSCSRAAAVLAL